MYFDILKDDKIPLEDFATKLFDDSGEQKIIPFLGAGVSLSAKSYKQPQESDFIPPTKTETDHILSSLDLQSQTAGNFLELAIGIARLMDSLDIQNDEEHGRENNLKTLENNMYPPSANELSELFSKLSKFSSFEQAVDNMKCLLPEHKVHENSDLLKMLQLLVKITGIAPSTEPLSSISNYYQAVSSRTSLWDNLHRIFASKEEFTITHELIARSAKFYLDQKVLKDYLIITTNYDCLMESALDALDIPYAVLAMNRKGKIVVRFSKDDEKLKKANPPGYPDKFFLTRARPMVVLYKIHGCLYKELDKNNDGIVITDDDYVDFISRMSKNEGAIPSYVGGLLQSLPFLFLGYSLNDWNVRSIFNMLVERRGKEDDVQDYSVMLSCNKYEEVFFRKNQIIIIQSDLNDFAKSVTNHAPEIQFTEEGTKSD